MSGAEIIPDLSVIVHRWIVKGGLVWVKEIVGGLGRFGPKNMFASWYLFIKNLIYSLSNIYKY